MIQYTKRTINKTEMTLTDSIRCNSKPETHQPIFLGFVHSIFCVNIFSPNVKNSLTLYQSGNSS